MPETPMQDDVKAILDAEEAALRDYISNHCQGDDPVKEHARTVADARLSEVAVLRDKLISARPVRVTEEAVKSIKAAILEIGEADNFTGDGDCKTHLDNADDHLRAALSALAMPGVVEGWRPVSELTDVMAVGDQMDVLFGSLDWGWPILGMVTRFPDELAWLEYDQQNDKFIEWASPVPTLWMRRPDLPALTGGEQ